MIETEPRPCLVLAVPPEAVALLKRLPWLRGAGGRSASSRTIYYDTPNLSLRDRAVAIVNGGDGTDAWPTLPDTPLRPVFEADLVRTVGRLVSGGSTVRVELTAGRLASAGAAEPYARLTLDLEDGAADGLVAAAIDLGRTHRVRLAVDSAIERGYALATGAGPEAIRIVRAKPVVLAPELTVEQGLARLLRSGLDHWIGNEAAVRRHRSAEGVHQMRVALRRLRAVLSQVRPMLPAAARSHGEDLRWLAARLGRARDWDVMLSETLLPVEAAFPHDPALAAVRRAAVAARDAAYADLEADLDGERYGRLACGFAAWSFGYGWRQQPLSPAAVRLFQPLAPYAADAMGRRCRKLFARVDRPSRLPSEAQHELRKRVKRLRYLLEFFEPLLPAKRTRGLLKHLAGLQDGLGRANDAAAVRGLLEQIATAGDPLVARGIGQVLGWVAAAGRDAGAAIDREWAAARP